MNDERSEFIKSLKTMPMEDLAKYNTSAKLIDRSVSFLGVGSLLIAMSVPTLIVIIPCGILTLLLAHASAGVSEIRKVINERLSKITDK